MRMWTPFGSVTVRVDRPIRRWQERRANPKLYTMAPVDVPAVETWTTSELDRLLKAVDRADELLCQECGDIVYDEEFIFNEGGYPLVLCSQQCRNDVLDSRAADERED